MKLESRRNLLIQSAKGGLLFFAASCFGGSFLAACKKNPAKEKAPEVNAKEVIEQASSSCPNQNELTEQERAIRASLKYVDKTSIPARTCKNCKLYTLPVNNALCGGCKVVPGPIHPEGYCTAWIPLM
jgi:hypothetical protein